MNTRILLAFALVLSACASDDTPVPNQNSDDMDIVDPWGTDGGVDADDFGMPDSSKSDGPDDGTATDRLDEILSRLDANPTEEVPRLAAEYGWPIAVKDGYLVVSLAPAAAEVAGDFDGFSGTALQARNGYSFAVIPATPGQKYKFKNGQDFFSDPISRHYAYDEFGEVSLIDPQGPYLARFFDVKNQDIPGRIVRVWYPAETPTHVLYAQDGQNLFDPNAIWGGWKMQESLPTDMMVVGIDNTAGRMDEYTHVKDDIGTGNQVGGNGDQYAEFIQNTVRPLVRNEFGEPEKVGLIGSSLGGLISLHIFDKYPTEYSFVASMSGTLGWGSIGLNNETIIQRFTGKGVRQAYIYIDSGGQGAGCVDADNDGTQDDDDSASDNYCENRQMESTLVGEGYEYGVNFTHWWEEGAPHNEAAWAARVQRPLAIFAAQ